MYARMTKFRTTPENVATMEDRIPGIKDHVAKIAGGIANYAVWNEDGTGYAVAIYEDEAAADAATPQIQQIWGGLADLLAEPPEITSYARVEQMR